MTPNHINLVIPMYASLYLGIKVAGVDMTLGVSKYLTPVLSFYNIGNFKFFYTATIIYTDGSMYVKFQMNFNIHLIAVIPK